MIPRLFFLKQDQQLVIESPTRRRVINGPGVYFSKPLEWVSRRQGIQLEPAEYLRLRNSLSGELSIQTGPQLYFLGPWDEVLAHEKALVLQQEQYLRMLNSATGTLRVLKGECVAIPGPTERVLQGVQQAIHIDGEKAVLIRDLRSGALALVTEPQVFVPEAHQEVAEVRELIQLEDHECVVVRSKDGSYTVHTGQSPERAFFLAPHCELLAFHWSSGIHKESRSLLLTRLDLRPKFMWYEFDVRTGDNVELRLGVTFFWQIEAVETMLGSTDDAPGDICSHSRSLIIQAVSQVSLEQFLADFNAQIRASVLGESSQFFKQRGLKIHAVEVRSVSCKDTATQQILQEIIQETTHRINLLQKQESENEVKLRQLQGQLALEKQREQLLHWQEQHQQAEGRIAGLAEAEKVKSFFEHLGELGPDLPMQIYQLLRKQDALA
ncbi:MAG: SPFH domain-containing protein, partial [Candidatus Sericytochromatia bacterium]